MAEIYVLLLPFSLSELVDPVFSAFPPPYWLKILFSGFLISVSCFYFSLKEIFRTLEKISTIYASSSRPLLYYSRKRLFPGLISPLSPQFMSPYQVVFNRLPLRNQATAELSSQLKLGSEWGTKGIKLKPLLKQTGIIEMDMKAKGKEEGFLKWMSSFLGKGERMKKKGTMVLVNAFVWSTY